MIHDDNLFQRFMYTFVQMTLNNQCDREEQLLDKLDNIARNLSLISLSEDLFSLFVRFEADLRNRCVRKDDWLFMLGKNLKGKYLDLYP